MVARRFLLQLPGPSPPMPMLVRSVAAARMPTLAIRAITEMRVRLMSCSKSAIVQLAAPLDLTERSSALEITHLSSPRRRPVWTGGGRPRWLECYIWLWVAKGRERVSQIDADLARWPRSWPR